MIDTEPNPMSYPLLKRLEFTLQSQRCELLNDGLVLIDLPGTESKERSLTKDLAERAVAEADIVCVVSDLASVSKGSIVWNILKRLEDESKTRKTVLVVTKGDHPVKNKGEESKLVPLLEGQDKLKYETLVQEISKVNS